MSKLYQATHLFTRVLYKIRHHNGHGIHSPFVFSFINDVIEEKLPYYAYQDIARYLNLSEKKIDEETKKNKLLFRIVNRFSPTKILEIGTGNGFSTIYLTAPSKRINCICIDANEDAKNTHKNWDRSISYSNWESIDKTNDTFDFILLNLNKLKDTKVNLDNFLITHIHANSVIVITDIRTNKANQVFWKNLVKRNNVIISLDLYHIGILLFNNKYYKQNYKLSF